MKQMPLYTPGEVVGFTVQSKQTYDKITMVVIEISETNQNVYYEFEIHGGRQRVDESRINYPERKAVPIRITKEYLPQRRGDKLEYVIEKNPKCKLCDNDAHTGGC